MNLSYHFRQVSVLVKKRLVNTGGLVVLVGVEEREDDSAVSRITVS